MNNLLIYILAVAVCLSLFVLAYQIILRNNTRFNLCRFYLISAILLSFLLPLVPIDLGISLIHKTEQKVPQIEVESIAMSSSQQTVTDTAVENGFSLNIDYLATLGVTLLSISLLLFIRFIYRFGSIILIQTSSKRLESEKGVNLIFTDRTDNAFSFLGYIFINPLKFNDEEKRLIIEHERVHIRHFHSIDLILIELLIVLQWFNPFAYIARRKLIEIHEFIADNGVIRNGADPYSYQSLLLSVVTSSCLPQVGNQLSALITKKRIAMIGKPMNQTGRWINFLILVPIAAILIIGISAFTPKERIDSNPKQEFAINETKPVTLLNKIISNVKNEGLSDKKIKIKTPIENESKRDNSESADLSYLSRKEVGGIQQNSIKKDELNLTSLKQQDNKSIKDELLKRAMAESKDAYLKDLYFSLPSNTSSTDISSNGKTTRYSVILMKGKIYSLNYLSGSKNDNLMAIIGSSNGDESIIESQFNFSYSTKKTFEPKRTAAYHLEIKNLSSKPAEALILLSFIGDVAVPKVSNSDYEKKSEQTKTLPNVVDTTEVFFVVETLPTFNGGDVQTEFKKYIAANLKYPKIASEKGIQGKVYVQFIVEKDGSLTNAKVLRSVDPILDKEALNIINNSPKWETGKQRGVPVRVSYTFPITFSLN